MLKLIFFFMKYDMLISVLCFLSQYIQLFLNIVELQTV